MNTFSCTGGCKFETVGFLNLDMSAARGLKVNWGVGAGRALAVREPPSEFIAQLQKTVDAREAAAEMFAESGLTAEVVKLNPPSMRR